MGLRIATQAALSKQPQGDACQGAAAAAAAAAGKEGDEPSNKQMKVAVGDVKTGGSPTTLFGGYLANIPPSKSLHCGHLSRLEQLQSLGKCLGKFSKDCAHGVRPIWIKFLIVLLFPCTPAHRIKPLGQCMPSETPKGIWRSSYKFFFPFVRLVRAPCHVRFLACVLHCLNTV